MPHINPDNIKLRCMPWKVAATFAPLDATLDRMEYSGYVDSARGFPVCEVNGEWCQIDECVTGIAEFFDLVASRKNAQLDTEPLSSLAKRLRNGVPLQLEDLRRARFCIGELKRFALNHLTAGEANAALRDVKIKWGMEDAMALQPATATH